MRGTATRFTFSLFHSSNLTPSKACTGVFPSCRLFLLSAANSATHTPPAPAASALRMASLATSAWDGTASQEELMLKDECILVDDADTIVGHANKYTSHRFTEDQPRGLLHRAFSVFLFDADNRLLLQQRAASKITFPRVWTNTCCSHQLYGYEPTGARCCFIRVQSSVQVFLVMAYTCAQ
jgi:NUDIX domain